MNTQADFLAHCFTMILKLSGEERSEKLDGIRAVAIAGMRKLGRSEDIIHSSFDLEMHASDGTQRTFHINAFGADVESAAIEIWDAAHETRIELDSLSKKQLSVILEAVAETFEECGAKDLKPGEKKNVEPRVLGKGKLTVH